jgi:hypothetical protein
VGAGVWSLAPLNFKHCLEIARLAEPQQPKAGIQNIKGGNVPQELGIKLKT